MNRTSSYCLQLRFRNDLLVSLLPPYLIIVLHASWFISFRLLQPQKKNTISIKNSIDDAHVPAFVAP
jgi:hypothetical protein